MTGFLNPVSSIHGRNSASPSHTPKVGAGCLNWARPDLCGGRSAMSVPTAIRRFAAWLKRSPDTATADEVRRFQLDLIETTSICNRNRIMTGVRFLFRVTLRRHDLAAEGWHIKEPERLPPVLSPEEIKRVLTMATSLKARAMLTLAYGCGLRAG